VVNFDRWNRDWSRGRFCLGNSRAQEDSKSPVFDQHGRSVRSVSRNSVARRQRFPFILLFGIVIGNYKESYRRVVSGILYGTLLGKLSP